MRRDKKKRTTKRSRLTLVLAGLGVALVLTVVLGLALTRRGGSAARAVPPMQDAVTDTAGRLTAADDRELEERIAAYRGRTGNEIAVLLVGSLGRETIEDVAYATFNAWGVGQKGKDNGVLLVIAPSERKTRIETGKCVGHLLTDIECARILRERVGPLLRQDRFKDAIVAALDAIEAALDERPPPAVPASLYAAAMVRGMYVIDATGSLGDAVVARLEEELARDGVLFSQIAIIAVDDPASSAAMKDRSPPWLEAHAALRQQRIKARLDSDPMLVFVGGTPPRSAVHPITVIQHERRKTVEPRFESAARGAPDLEGAIRAIGRDQIAFARHYAEWERARAEARAAEERRSDTILIVVIGGGVSLFVALLVWLGLRSARSGGGSSWDYHGSSGSTTTSYDTSSSHGSSSSSSSSDTSYTGGGGSSGGGGASDSY